MRQHRQDGQEARTSGTDELLKSNQRYAE